MGRVRYGLLSVALAAAWAIVIPASQGCHFRVTPTRVELNGSATSGLVGVETEPGCAWTADSTVAWVRVGTAGASGAGVIPYQVDASPAALRQGTIRVRWNTATAGENVYVTQTNGSCGAIFYPPTGPTSARTVGWKGGSHSFEVLAEPPFSGLWRVTSAPDWIVFTSPALGLLGRGDGSTGFNVAPNPSPAPRDGTVTFCSGPPISIHQSGRSQRTGDAVPADFDDDGRADLVVYRPSTGTWYVLRSSSGYSYGDNFSAQWGTSGTAAIPGDFDGDNRMELAVYDPNGLWGSARAGNWNIRYSSNGYSADTQTSYAFPTRAYNYSPQSVPLLADFNGDGRPDFVTWRPDTAEWSVELTDFRIPSRLPNHFPAGEYNGHWQWGLPGDVPVPADFDGDRLADLAVWRPSNGVWYVRLSSEDYHGLTHRAYQWGLPGDRPIAGDFDGDGRADLAVWRPSDGAWYIANSSAGYSALTRIQWGLPGDVPVANDYDGDGRTDLAVWRPSNGSWYILISSRGYSYAFYSVFQWGLPGDVPLSARITGSQ